MNLLVFNLATDARHVSLSFGLRWITELAKHFDHVDVVTMYAGEYRLPANVTVWSVGREHGYSKVRRVVRFYRIVGAILRQRKIDVAFTHMIHVFAVLFAPLARALRIPNVLWYAHGSVPIGLRIAHVCVDRVASSTPQGFRLRSTKVSYIGQGIDTHQFVPAASRAARPFHIVSVGRIAPVKGLDILLDALAGWFLPGESGWKLTIVGSATTPAELQYQDEIKRRAAQLGGGGVVELRGRLDAAMVSRLLQQADVFVNLSETGSLDKAIVEAMACGCPVLSCNEAYHALADAHQMPELKLVRSALCVRQSLEWFAALNAHRREELGRKARTVACTEHSLDRLIGSLRELLVKQAGRYAHA